MVSQETKNISKDEKYIHRFYEPDLKAPLQMSSFNKNPFEEFRLWFLEAVKTEKGIEPNAMAVATATKDGFPSVRYVLLKYYDNSNFVFFTNYESRKSKEILENPKASFLFYWPTLQKQVRIEGTLQKTSPEISHEYFQSRDIASKVGSYYSNQSNVMSEQQRNQFFEKIEEVLQNEKKVECPNYWGGFQLKPESFEFMLLQKSRKHDRVSYKDFDGENWKMNWLMP